jgi:hypothetical protein
MSENTVNQPIQSSSLSPVSELLKAGLELSYNQFFMRIEYVLCKCTHVQSMDRFYTPNIIHSIRFLGLRSILMIRAKKHC